MLYASFEVMLVLAGRRDTWPAAGNEDSDDEFQDAQQGQLRDVSLD